MAKPTPKPKMKNGAVSDAAKFIKIAKPTFSNAEIKKFRAVKTGAEVLSMKPKEAEKFMKWQAQRSTAEAKRFMKKKGML
jgi:hypothetical protein